MPPPIVTSLPWLANQPDPVASYQRSQALVQQMQAQQAQERQAQAALAQRAQEAAMQAQFQQRALELKEREARSAVQLEADRLRQRGQALEFENQARQAEQRYLQTPPELVDLGGGARGVKYRGSFHPVREPVITAAKPTPQELSEIRKAEDVDKFQRARLLAKEKALQKIQPGTPGHDALPDEASQLSAVRQYLALQKELDMIGRKGEKATPSPAIKPSVAAPSAGVRIRRKSDGKILRYQGNRADVPTDQFEIVE